jgi:hypothetical protein
MEALWYQPRRCWRVIVPRRLSETGKRCRRFFQTKGDAEKYILEIKRRGSVQLADLSIEEIHVLGVIRQSQKYAPGMLLEAWQRFESERIRDGKLTVQQLCEKFLARQIAERRSAQTIADDRWRLNTFSRAVGKSRVAVRVMWSLLRRFLDQEDRTAVLLNAVRFRTAVQTAGRDCSTEEFVRRMVRADILYWDDLGQMHLTGAATEMLLHIVEERTCAEMPILATTQYSGEGMDSQFERKETGKAIRRRLNEFCRVVLVRSVRNQTTRSSGLL